MINNISFEFLGLLLFSTIFLSMLFVPAVSRLALFVGAIDTPNSRSSHSSSIPRMGGGAISLTLLIACVAYLPHDSFFVGFISGLLIISITGVIDDIFEIPPKAKLFGQIVAAVFFVYFSGMKIEGIGDIFGEGEIRLGSASFTFTVFCIVGGMNAFNLSDGLDGLAGGLAVIATVFLGYFAWRSHNNSVLFIATALLGSTLGFLRYNSYPAKIFMGDTGSLMLGYTIAVILVSLSRSLLFSSVVSLPMVVALPLLDTLFVMFKRVHLGLSPFRADRTHLHHQLLELGLPHPAAVGVIYLTMFGFGALAVYLQSRQDSVIFFSMLAAGGAFYLSLSLLKIAGVQYKSKHGLRNRFFRDTTLYRIVQKKLKNSAKLMGLLILAALLIPAFAGHLVEVSHSKAIAIFLIAGLMASLSWLTPSANKSVLYGSLYLGVWTLLLIFEVSTIRQPSWLGFYLEVVSAITLSWVTLKIIFSEHNEIIFASGFELLILFISWFIPFVVLKEVHLREDLITAVQHGCLISIPFLLSMKINIRIFGKEKHWVTIPLFIGLVTVGVRVLAL